MSVTLKDHYKLKKIKLLKERLVRIDSNLISEQKSTGRMMLLVEAMDENDLEKVTGIINKLRILQNMAQNSGALSGIIDNALMDLQKITGGEQSLGQKFLSAIKLGNNAKIFKNTMILVSSLETGFRLMPQLLKNMMGGIKGNSAQANQTVADLLMGEGFLREANNDPEVETKPVNNLDSMKTTKGAEKMDLLVKNISKAMKPSKWLGMASGKIPYIDDPDSLVTDLLNSVPVGTLMKIVRTISGGVQASNLTQALEKSNKESQGTEGTDQSQSTIGTNEKGTEQSTPSDESTVTKFNKQDLAAMTSDIANASGVDKKTVNKIMSTFVKDVGLQKAVIQLLSGLSESKMLRSESALELLKVLAKTGKLTETINNGKIKILLDKSEIQNLVTT